MQTPALGIFHLCQQFLANYSDVPPFLQYANWINTMKNDRIITSPPVHCSVGRTQRKFSFPQVLWELNCNSRGSAGGTDCFIFYSSNASAFSSCLHPWRGWSTLSSLSKVTVQSVFSHSSNKSAAQVFRFWIEFQFWVLFNRISLGLPLMLFSYLRILNTEYIVL